MADDKILSSDDAIGRASPACRELIDKMRNAAQLADNLIADVRPCLLDERYFTTEQVIYHFNISRRALQGYRDKGIIPYTSIGSVILYPESGMREVLERNYYKLKNSLIKDR